MKVWVVSRSSRKLVLLNGGKKRRFQLEIVSSNSRSSNTVVRLRLRRNCVILERTRWRWWFSHSSQFVNIRKFRRRKIVEFTVLLNSSSDSEITLDIVYWYMQRTALGASI